MREEPFEAVISDMDGVLTRTATLHEQAWKQIFDDFLEQRAGQRPFSSADYLVYVNGKPRYQGVTDFLASREIELPYGQESDPPDRETIFGLGKRKNARFVQLLARRGVQVFEDALTALRRWRRGDLKLAAMSSSRNCRQVLKAGNLEQYFDVIVDGQLAADLGLSGKPGIMLEAARRLGVKPHDAVILEDASAGVRAGREDGFGLVIGIARSGNERELREAGAHAVVTSLLRARFPRRIPSALDRLWELEAWLGDRDLVVLLDYDGTLSPIVDDPKDAWMSNETRSAVMGLVDRCTVAIVSGRDRRDVESRVGLDGLFYAGNHGFDIAGPGGHMALPEAERFLHDVERAANELENLLGPMAGVLIERKRFSVAVHFRRVESRTAIAEVERIVASIHDRTGLRIRTGKQVLELEPAVDWDKGRALEWLVNFLPNVRLERSFVLYIGDDETDEDAFAALEGHGAGVRVGAPIANSLADYRLKDPGEVCELLSSLSRSTAGTRIGR